MEYNKADLVEGGGDGWAGPEDVRVGYLATLT